MKFFEFLVTLNTYFVPIISLMIQIYGEFKIKNDVNSSLQNLNQTNTNYITDNHGTINIHQNQSVNNIHTNEKIRKNQNTKSRWTQMLSLIFILAMIFLIIFNNMPKNSFSLPWISLTQNTPTLSQKISESFVISTPVIIQQIFIILSIMLGCYVCKMILLNILYPSRNRYKIKIGYYAFVNLIYIFVSQHNFKLLIDKISIQYIPKENLGTFHAFIVLIICLYGLVVLWYFIDRLHGLVPFTVVKSEVDELLKHIAVNFFIISFPLFIIWGIPFILSV